MVPANDGLWPPCLLEHVHHVGLEDVVDGLDGDCRPGLWHGKYVNHLHSIFIHESAKHKTHDFHRYTGASVLQHLDAKRLGYVGSILWIPTNLEQS